MTVDEFDKCLKAYHPCGNDNRYVFTDIQVKEIKAALIQKSLIDEIRDLIQEENASTTKN